MRFSCISETSSTEVKFYYNYFAFPWNFPFPRPPSLPCLKTTSLYGFLLHQFQEDFIFFSIEEFYDSINRSIKKFYQDFQEKWRKNFLLENFTEIIKSLIKILAPQFFPRSNILILEIPRNSAISILTESHLENFTRAKFNIFSREEYQGSSNGYQ